MFLICFRSIKTYSTSFMFKGRAMYISEFWFCKLHSRGEVTHWCNGWFYSELPGKIRNFRFRLSSQILNPLKSTGLFGFSWTPCQRGILVLQFTITEAKTNCTFQLFFPACKHIANKWQSTSGEKAGPQRTCQQAGLYLLLKHNKVVYLSRGRF